MLKPRHAVHPTGTFVFKNGVPFAYPESVACGISHTRFMDDGGAYTLGNIGPAIGPEVPKELLSIPFSLVVNGTVTPFAVDPKVAKAVVYRAGNCELQVTQYPKALKCRVRYRVKATDKIDMLAVRIGGVAGFGYVLNYDRDGQWDGRVTARTRSGAILHALVMDAREKYPRGYILSNSGLDLSLHDNQQPKDTSKAGVTDLRAYLTGTFSTALPPEYAALLTNDPDIKQAAQEVSASDQATRVSDTCLGMDFWLSIGEPVEPQPPLVLLDGFESPIWSKPKPGIENAGLQAAENRILALVSSKLAAGPRGSILYGDIPEQPDSFYRVRFGAAHYFVPTLAWRSLLRTGNPEWCALARVFTNFVRDSTWLDGQQDHGKGLLPWSGPRSSNGCGHWVDSECLLMAFLCDGDALSLLEYERWLKAVTPPTETSREAVVPMRMFRIAAWYTGDAKWTQWADTIEARMHAAIKAGVQMTGPNWHPLAYKVPPNLSGQCPEGILSIRQLAAQQKLDDVSAYILYGGRPLDGQATGFGPLGEAHVGLQLDAPGGVYDYYRARPLQGKHRVIYGTSKDGRARVTIDKQDDQPSSLRIALGSRGGDIPGTLVEVYGPDGSHKTFFDYRVDESVRFPKYPLTPDVQGWIDGFQVVQKSIPFEGPAGRYQIEVWGHSKVMLHGPLSKFPEWQDTCGEFSYEGQDASGAWPLGSVMVGN